MELWIRLLCDDEGQDLIEYTLLMSFVALAAVTLLVGLGNSVRGIWTTANTKLTTANTTAS